MNGLGGITLWSVLRARKRCTSGAPAVRPPRCSEPPSTRKASGFSLKTLSLHFFQRRFFSVYISGKNLSPKAPDETKCRYFSTKKKTCVKNDPYEMTDNRPIPTPHFGAQTSLIPVFLSRRTERAQRRPRPVKMEATTTVDRGGHRIRTNVPRLCGMRRRLPLLIYLAREAQDSRKDPKAKLLFRPFEAERNERPLAISFRSAPTAILVECIGSPRSDTALGAKLVSIVVQAISRGECNRRPIWVTRSSSQVTAATMNRPPPPVHDAEDIDLKILAKLT